MTAPTIPGFRGRIIAPSDTEFEVARLTRNAAHDARPALIARATDADDVAAAVRFAHARGETLAIRSVGHSVAGHSTGENVVVLDLAALDGIAFDRDGATAWVGPGVTAGAFTQAAFERGRAVSFGDTGTVGLGGLIPGGGIGWLVRRSGLTIDSLLEAEVITADGVPTKANASANSDLFWAIRGGGGNFGVVTRYRLALHPIGGVLHGTLLMPATAEIVRAVLAFGSAAPDDLTLMPYVMAIPPINEVPASHHGRLGLWVDTLWAGGADAGASILDGLRSIGTVLMDDVHAKPYPRVYGDPSGNRPAWGSSSTFLDHVDADVVDVVLDRMTNALPGDALAVFRVLGGAAGRVANDATAFGWRDKPFLLWLIADYGADSGADRPRAAYDAWLSGFRDALAVADSGAFVSFMSADDQQTVASCYPAATFNRLREIKRRWDPANLFRHNHNIPPA